MLKGLARWLRAGGYDADWSYHIEDAELVLASRRENRVLLTSDSGIMKLNPIQAGEVTALFVPRDLNVSRQVEHVFHHFGLKRLAPRCMKCGGALAWIPKACVRLEAPPRTYSWLNDFYRCLRCGQLFWKGTHWKKISQKLQSALSPGTNGNAQSRMRNLASEWAHRSAPPGNAETGQPWVPVTGTWGINGNKAYCVSDASSGYMAWVDSGVADGILDCTVRGIIASGVDFHEPALVIRANDANNILRVGILNGGLTLGKIDGGAWTQLANAAQATLDNTDYAIRVIMIGNNIRIYVDGTEKISYTLAGGDTKYAAYTKHGFRTGLGGNPASKTAARWDNFKFQTGLP